MPASEGDLAPFQHARQGRKGPNEAGTWVGASREVAQTQLFGAAPRIWRALSRSQVDHSRTSPAGLSSFIAPDPHAGSGGGCGLSASIRRRMSANSDRGTATSANWNTT
jgi:hypothetical protein